MHHKRRRPKARRAGCLMCKPHKFGHGMENDLGSTAYRREVLAKTDIKEAHDLRWRA